MSVVVLRLTTKGPSFGKEGKREGELEREGGKEKHPLTPAPYRIVTAGEERERKREVPDIRWWGIAVVVGVLVAELGCYLALLGIGGHAALKGYVPAMCGPGVGVLVGLGWTKANPLPVDVVVGEAITVVVTVMETGVGNSSTATESHSETGSLTLSTGQLTDGGVTVVNRTTITTIVQLTVGG